MNESRCKNCGGICEISNTSRFVKCEYCGSVFELDANRAEFANLYSRADDAWSRKDFDEALKVYLQIAEKDNLQSEAHWGAALCRYGIAYEIDPVSGEKKPTCNRINRESIFEDKNYIAAIKHASPENKQKYLLRATEIDRISVEFLKIVENEAPYDVFISYKRTDDRGLKTIDAEYAMKLYIFLKNNGIKVFFAEETLKNIAGSLYEPYIFAALQSAKVMVLIGSNKENLESTWVRNEWQRFLKLMELVPNKALIPAYIGDPYEVLPQRLSPLQAFNAGSPAFVDEILENIRKKLTTATQQIEHTKGSTQQATVESLLERAFMFVNDGEFEKSSKQLEKVLDIDPKCAEAYLCGLMIEFRVTSEGQLGLLSQRIDLSPNYKKINMFGNESIKQRVSRYSEVIIQNIGMAEMKKQEVLQARTDLLEKVSYAETSLDRINHKREKLKSKIAEEEASLLVLKNKINFAQNQKAGIKKKRFSPIWFVLLGLALDVYLILIWADKNNSPSSLYFFLAFFLPASIISSVVIIPFLSAAAPFVSVAVFALTFIVVAVVNGGGIITSILGVIYDFTLGLLFNDRMVLTDMNLQMALFFGAQALYIIAFMTSIVITCKQARQNKVYRMLEKEIKMYVSEYNAKAQQNTVLIQLRSELEQIEADYNAQFESFRRQLLKENSEYLALARKAGVRVSSALPSKYL